LGEEMVDEPLRSFFILSDEAELLERVFVLLPEAEVAENKVREIKLRSDTRSP